MTADPDASRDAATEDPAVAESGRNPYGTDEIPADARDSADAAEPGVDEAAAEDIKAKFREALAHKQGSHGASHTEHGDRGATTHGPEQAHGHRMFRRKSG